MPLLMMLSLAAAQPVPPAAQPPIAIRPGQVPEGTSPMPITEMAEPLALAVAAFDADHDGRTTRAEYDAALARTFAAADVSGDGLLGYIEYAGWAQTWLGSQSALPGPYSIDADGDDRLSREEFAAEFGRQFVRLDKDADGAVSHAELLTIRNPQLRPVFDRQGRPIRNRQRREAR